MYKNQVFLCTYNKQLEIEILEIFIIVSWSVNKDEFDKRCTRSMHWELQNIAESN